MRNKGNRMYAVAYKDADGRIHTVTTETRSQGAAERELRYFTRESPSLEFFIAYIEDPVWRPL